MRGEVYSGVRIMPGSDGWELLQDMKAGKKGAKEALDKHMAELDKAWKKLEGRK